MKASNRYTWFVGIVALAIVVYITVNTLRTSGHGSRGLQRGDHLPAFAAPLATSDYPDKADADTGGSKTPPCRLTDPRALNLCALRRRPVVLAFTVVGNGTCEKQLDAMERVKDRFPQVNFAAVAIKAKRSDIAPVVRKHGWTFPVAYDHDGAVGNLYDVVVCPAVTFAWPGGTVRKTSLGSATLKPAVLSTDIRALLRTRP
jgi:peroxiredoxin